MRTTTTAALVTALLVSGPGAALAAQAPEPIEQELFSSWVGKYQDLSVDGLWKAFGLPATPSADPKLSFSPAKAEFYDRVVKALGLSPAARAQLERDGVIAVPQRRLYSMAAALYEMYTLDLPLLVTTDAILDAMHRSQLVVSPPNSPTKVAPPALFQLFGQRFILDSFVLSKVVYDDIIFEGQKMQRRMPLDLDVMAALGSMMATWLRRSRSLPSGSAGATVELP